MQKSINWNRVCLNFYSKLFTIFQTFLVLRGKIIPGTQYLQLLILHKRNACIKVLLIKALDSKNNIAIKIWLWCQLSAITEIRYKNKSQIKWRFPILSKMTLVSVVPQVAQNPKTRFLGTATFLGWSISSPAPYVWYATFIRCFELMSALMTTKGFKNKCII